ncbi:hypothetical protein N7475_006070 [Penicillium sp. IBT 31633x]|nr:hypothetical protein N7475_006070 [Penicillium sp. IBT 31633x]
MSADLLAAFGQPGPVQEETRSSGHRPPHYAQSSFFNDENDDFFGPPRSVQHGNPNSSVGAAPHQEYDLPVNSNSEVLFDAAIAASASDADEDDWGEFEGPKSSIPDASSMTADHPRQSSATTELRASGTIDLLDSLSIQDSAPKSGDYSKLAVDATNQHLQVGDNNLNQTTWNDDSFGDWGDFADAPASRPCTEKVTEKKAKPPQKLPVSTWDDDAFDDWGDFADGPSVKTAPEPTPTPNPAPRSFVSPTAAPAATVRPTNIPPPSVLLELFLEVFESLQKEAILAKSQLRSSSPNNVATTALNIHNALQSAARVIAGRRLRWKRDTFLSQSMRIGPARSGKAGGMKLNSVNKQENIKEEQDAVDVVTTWRERAAVFNIVLQAAGQRPIPTVPDPSSLKVITARADQGALKASHPCALCSLKRDERVLRVDEQNVQDSFGEWWTEHWGHTACRQFWETNRHLLGQR